jgi:hypothetical protein
MIKGYKPLLYLKRLRTYFVYAALFWTFAGTHAAQEAGSTQSAESGGASMAPSSDSAPFEVAPGISLPPKGIVWILDMVEGKPDLVRAALSNAKFNTHVGENIARSQFFLKSVATLELPPAAANLRVCSRTPVIYIRRSVQAEEELQAAPTGGVHYVLLRTKVVDDRRVIYGFSAAPFYGRFTRKKADEVEISSEEVDAGQWLKIAPKQPLPDGEYVVNAMPDDKKLTVTFVYDFGIGPPSTEPPH